MHLYFRISVFQLLQSLENASECNRIQLVCHFDTAVATTLPPHDPLFCSDVCAGTVNEYE